MIRKLFLFLLFFLCLFFIAFVFFLFSPLLFPSWYYGHTRFKIGVAKKGHSELLVALNAFYEENDIYPPGSLYFGEIPLELLTTPLNYLKTETPKPDFEGIPIDPFRKGTIKIRSWSRNKGNPITCKGALPMYFTDGKSSLLISFGPDKDLDFNPRFYHFVKDYESLIKNYCLTIYDSSNGSISNGDILKLILPPQTEDYEEYNPDNYY